MASGAWFHEEVDAGAPRRKTTDARWQALVSESRTMRAIDALGPRPTDEVRLPTAPESAARARRVAVSVMRLWGLEIQADIAELLVSELVGNVVRHTGVRTFGLNLDRRRGRVRVEVRDASRSLPCLIDAGADAESGRGLYLVDALADRWGVELLPRGKSVWFELDVNPEPLAVA
nr:ATP-binding protein [Mangrovactinospora gilvigrisea]